MAGFLNSSIGKKFLMSLSGLFLILFVGLHAFLNSLLLVGKDVYNAAAHFMATNPFIKVMEPILALGFIVHIIYAFILEISNYYKRGPARYAKATRRHQSTWSSRNMIWLGIIILVFLIVHLANFYWKIKVTGQIPMTELHGEQIHDTYALVTSLFQSSLIIDLLYVLGAFALGMHLHHAFWSAFQTLGWSNEKWRKILSTIGDIYAVVVSVAFGIIPIYFYFFH